MAEKKVNAEEITRKVNVVRGADYGIIYTDTVRMNVSQFDIKLTFSITDILPNNEIQINEIITLAMSPQHAKVVAEKLTEKVAQYERDVISLQISKENQKKLQPIEIKMLS